MHTALVKTDVAAVDLRKSIWRIEELVDGGTPAEAGLLWVFNLAKNPAGRRRDLRFWRPELLERDGENGRTRSMALNQVVDEILPVNRAIFHAGEVDQMFQIRPRTRIDLHSELDGKQKGSRFVYSRTKLASFLNRRWLGQVGGITK